MLPPLPRAAMVALHSAILLVVPAFPGLAAGSARASSFSRFARFHLRCGLHLRRCHRIVARLPEGFNHFVSSAVALALLCGAVHRVGLSPTGVSPYHGARQLRTVGPPLQSGRGVVGGRQKLSPSLEIRVGVQVMNCAARVFHGGARVAQATHTSARRGGKLDGRRNAQRGYTARSGRYPRTCDPRRRACGPFWLPNLGAWSAHAATFIGAAAKYAASGVIAFSD